MKTSSTRSFPWTPALTFAALAATVGLPFALRPKDRLLDRADETLVIVTPHNESIRFEFTRGFREWYQAKTGKTVRIDWRIPGGTSEIARYLQSAYQTPFERYWKQTAGGGGQPFTATVQGSFDNPKVTPGPDPSKDTEAEAARRAFLGSSVSSGIDLFFGGGSFDFVQQANAGRLVDSGIIQAHPELFNEANIPPTLGGEPYHDQQGRWVGVVLSSFGICYNTDVLAPPAKLPKNWDDLADPAHVGTVALADPNQSGSVARAFELIIQQQIQQQGSQTRVSSDDNQRQDGDAANQPDVPAAWDRAMRLVMRMGANARYFADAATKVPIDVAQGDAALGMCIDFYGRFESENARLHSGRDRMHYFNPPGGTSFGVDPIGLLRGAPHPEPARAFIEYTLSLEGQRLWNWRVGTPGGPQQYALRRLPVRWELYASGFREFRSDPDVFPYEEAKDFTYHPEWTAALFNPLRFIVRVMCVDPHEEARAAWAALIQANFPPEATAVFDDVSTVAYDQAKGRINDTLRNPDKLTEARLAAELTERFRAQYHRAETLARAGK